MDSNDFVLLCDAAKAFVVRVADIVSCESVGNYITVNLAANKILIRKPLHVVEDKLDSSAFFRTSRDCIVNLGHVRKTELHDPRRFAFAMSDGRKIVLSRKQSIAFRRGKSL